MLHAEGRLVCVAQHKRHPIYKRCHLIMLVDFDALAHEVFVKLLLVLIGATSSSVDLAIDEVVVLYEADEVVDFVRWKTFQVDLVAIFELYCCEES